MNKKESFVLYVDFAEQFYILNDEQAGKLIKAIFAYVESGMPPEFDDGMIKIAFSFIKSQLDRDHEKWESSCRWYKSYAENFGNEIHYYWQIFSGKKDTSGLSTLSRFSTGNIQIPNS